MAPHPSTWCVKHGAPVSMLKNPKSMVCSSSMSGRIEQGLLLSFLPPTPTEGPFPVICNLKAAKLNDALVKDAMCRCQ